MKRLIALLLVVFAVMAILPMSVFAAAGGSEVEQEAVGGEVTANANANNYFYIAMWDGSTYQTSNNWYKSGSYAYGRRSGSASASNYDLKVLQSYTPALSGVSVSWTSYSSGSGYWRAYKNISSGTLSAANALPTSDPMSYNNSWKLVGFSNVSTSSSYTIDASFSSYNTAVSSWSDLRSKISGGASSNGSSYYVLFYSNASGSSGGTTTQPTTYVYPAYLNGSSYTRNADYYYYSSQSNYHVKVGGTAGITLYDLKLKGTYTAGSGTTVSNNFTTSTNATSKWTVTKSSGTLNATDAIPTSETSIIPAYNNGWKLVGYSYTANEPGSTLPTMTAVSSYSDLRTKLSGQSASATQAKHLILYFAKPIAARMCHYVDSTYVGYETVNMFLNTPVQITASTAGKDYFDTENKDYNFVFWADMSEAAYGNVTFGSVTANPTTVTGTATNSSGEIRFKCAWSSSAKTKTHNLVVKTSINGDIVSTSEPITIKETFTQSIQADTSMFNNNAYTYTFVGWSLTSGSVSNANSQTTTFTMGTADAVATAVFTATALNNPGGGGSGTGTGTNPEDGEFQIKFYVLYVDSSYNLGYNYESGWDVYYNCQDAHCTHVNATSHSMAKSVIRAQIANATVTEGWKILGWTKTVSADPTINSAEGNDNVLITVGNSIYLVAKKDAAATAEKTFTVQYKLDGTTKYSTSVTLTKPIWEDATINAEDYLAQAEVPATYALTGTTTYTHAWATFPANVDFAIEEAVLPFAVSGSVLSASRPLTDYAELAYRVGHYTEFDAAAFTSFRRTGTATINGLTAPTEVTVYAALRTRAANASFYYVTITPTAAAITVDIDGNFIVVTGAVNQIAGMWIAQGHYTTYSAMKSAGTEKGFKNITNKWKYSPLISTEDLEYTYYVKTNDGASYFDYITVPANAIPEVEIIIDGLTVFVTDETKDYVAGMWVAKGTYTSYGAMKADRDTNGFAILTKSKAYTFTNISAPTEITIYFTTVNGESHLYNKNQHPEGMNLILTPEFSVSVTLEDGVVTVAASSGEFSDIVTVHYCAGHCTTYGAMKASPDFHTANKTHKFTPQFDTYGVNQYTVRVITSEGNELYFYVDKPAA